MPTAVLMMIGQTEVMKMTKIADGWLSRNAASEIGSQASGGTVRRTWKIGSSPRIAQTDWPMRAPSRTPTIAAMPKPIATRCSEVNTRQPSPMSCGPATKNGSTIRSRASVQIRDGDGRVAPGFMHRSCQMPSMRQSMMSGGTTRAATAFAAGSRRVLTKLAGGSFKRTTSPGVGGKTAAGWILRAGMVIRCLRLEWSGEYGAHTSTRLIARLAR